LAQAFRRECESSRLDKYTTWRMMVHQSISTRCYDRFDSMSPSLESIFACSVESGTLHDAEDDVEKVIAGIADVNVQKAFSLIVEHIKRVALDVKVLKRTGTLTPDKSLDLGVNVQQASPCTQHARIFDPPCSAFRGETCKKDFQSEWQPLQPHVSHPVLHPQAPMRTLPEMKPPSPPREEHSRTQKYEGSQPNQEQRNEDIKHDQNEQEASTYQVRVRSPQPNGKAVPQLPMWLRPSIVQESGQPSSKIEAPRSCGLPIQRKPSSSPIPASKFMSWPRLAGILTE